MLESDSVKRRVCSFKNSDQGRIAKEVSFRERRLGIKVGGDLEETGSLQKEHVQRS